MGLAAAGWVIKTHAGQYTQTPSLTSLDAHWLSLTNADWSKGKPGCPLVEEEAA